MTREDQRIIATVVDLLGHSAQCDVAHAHTVRCALRAALQGVRVLEGASRAATRRKRELQRRDEAAARKRLTQPTSSPLETQA